MLRARQLSRRLDRLGRLGIDRLGPDRVIYGSDAPPLTSLKPRAIKLIRDLDIPEAQREAIFYRNAAKLLKLPLA